jgi:hypothetical protein
VYIAYPRFVASQSEISLQGIFHPNPFVYIFTVSGVFIKGKETLKVHHKRTAEDV